MKKIEAIIRYSKFEEVKEALAEIGVKFFSLKDVKGFGLQETKKTVYRGTVYNPDYIARLQLDLVIPDSRLEEVVDVIISSAKTGEVGDGKLFVFDVPKAYRIRNGEVNESAL